MDKNTPKETKSLRKIDEDSFQDPSTGAIYSKVNANWIANRIRPKIKENFMLAFQQEFADLAEKRLSGMEYSVLLFLLASVDYDCTTSIHQKEIAERLNCKKQVISRAVLRLKEEELIKFYYKRGYSSTYFVNPYLCIRGNEKNRKEIIREWELLQ